MNFFDFIGAGAKSVVLMGAEIAFPGAGAAGAKFLKPSLGSTVRGAELPETVKEIPFELLKKQIEAGKPGEKSDEECIAELKAKISTQFDALEVGASRMLKVAVMFKYILGQEFSNENFRTIHATNCPLKSDTQTDREFAAIKKRSDRDFKAAIFAQAKKNLDFGACAVQKDDSLSGALSKRADFLSKMGALVACHLTYNLTEGLLGLMEILPCGGVHSAISSVKTVVIDRFVAALEKDKEGEFNKELRDKIFEAANTFLINFLVASAAQDEKDKYIRKGELQATSDVSKDNTANEIKFLMEGFFSQKIAPAEFSRVLVNYVLTEFSGGKMNYILKRVLTFLLADCNLIDVPQLFNQLDTCICESDGKPSHTINMAVIAKLDMIKKLLTMKQKEGDPCPVYSTKEKESLKALYNKLYDAIQHERMHSLDEKTRKLAESGQAYMDTIINPGILGPVVDKNADVIVNLIKGLLSPKIVLEILETSLINSNGLLFGPLEDASNEEKSAAREKLSELLKDVLDIVVQDNVEDLSKSVPGLGEVLLHGGTLGEERMYAKIKYLDKEIKEFQKIYAKSSPADQKKHREEFVLTRAGEMEKIQACSVMDEGEKRQLRQAYRNLEVLFKQEVFELGGLGLIHYDIEQFLKKRTELSSFSGKTLSQPLDLVSTPIQNFVKGGLDFVANKVTVHYLAKAVIKGHLFSESSSSK